MQTNRIIQTTEDVSHTIFIPELNITYHSKFGAVQESMHVFIKEGLHYFLKSNLIKEVEPFYILEIGLGTGLNALLSFNEAIHLNKKIFYTAIEPYSISVEEAMELNYVSKINPNLKTEFFQLHTCEWNKEVAIHPLFIFKKVNDTLQNFNSLEKFYVIYFDAFDPKAQPELWTESIFKKLFNFLYKDGVLVTYCSKGAVRRAMLAAGFSVDKIKGPPGKREIVRANK